MNRFSYTQPADPADAARAADLRVRANALQASGLITDEQRRAAWNLGLLRRAVEKLEAMLQEAYDMNWAIDMIRELDCTCAPELPDGRGAPCGYCAARAANTEMEF